MARKPRPKIMPLNTWFNPIDHRPLPERTPLPDVPTDLRATHRLCKQCFYDGREKYIHPRHNFRRVTNDNRRSLTTRHHLCKRCHDRRLTKERKRIEALRIKEHVKKSVEGRHEGYE